MRSPDLQLVTNRLQQCKAQLNLHQEVKWQKVTENYLEKSKALTYRHWKFVPAKHEIDRTKTKK